MHCHRCGRSLGPRNHFCMFYARRTDGMKQGFCLCAKCTTEFGDFMKAGMPEDGVDAKEDNAQESETETAYIN